MSAVAGADIRDQPFQIQTCNLHDFHLTVIFTHGFIIC